MKKATFDDAVRGWMRKGFDSMSASHIAEETSGFTKDEVRKWWTCIERKKTCKIAMVRYRGLTR